MPWTEDMTIRIKAIDEASPVINRIRRRLWWMEHGEGLMRAVTVLLAAAAFILGRLTS